jgi:hypothetical protein
MTKKTRDVRLASDQPRPPGAGTRRVGNVLLALEPDTYRAALVRAAHILGGAVALSRRLQVPMSDLTRWLAGDGRPSIGVFLRVIDVMLEEERKGGARP